MHRMMSFELNELWHYGKLKNKQKVEFLSKKWIECVGQPVEVNGVKYRDEDS